MTGLLVCMPASGHCFAEVTTLRSLGRLDLVPPYTFFFLALLTSVLFPTLRCPILEEKAP